MTCVMYSPDRRMHFDPVTDTEIFDSYISSLRYLARERASAMGMGARCYNETPIYRCEFGRQEMFSMCFDLLGNHYRWVISRINENGLH